VIFALTPSHGGYAQTVLHSITGRQTGLPLGPLLLAPNGTLYGTMVLGGGGCSGIGCGQVFKLGRNGSKYFWSVIFGFRNALNGADPENTSLIQDASGAIYGTTRSGGTQTGCSDGGPGGALGCGVVFKLTNA
ncbi:MAG TPA: choice-of-anchor tandem repeat GloVer-containing protein, partial [Candidatus Baltobacteraceae bacterium]|nr:choice-of-anchor tandem repeat GloVer-containing protein [Candidatus Baltobacteraceae bacterium]